jgi:hypothetical protein
MTDQEKSIVSRMNRRLAADGQRLTVSRNPNGLGRYVILDAHNGNPVAWADSLDQWAREMGVAS